MNLKYEYYWYQNALTKQQCSDVIAMGLNKMEENRRKGQSNDGVTYSDNYKGSKGFDVELGNKTIQEIEKEHGFASEKDMMLLVNENNDGNYGMKYDRVVPILVNAIKELSAKVTALEAG